MNFEEKPYVAGVVRKSVMETCLLNSSMNNDMDAIVIYMTDEFVFMVIIFCELFFALDSYLCYTGLGQHVKYMYS